MSLEIRDYHYSHDLNFRFVDEEHGLQETSSPDPAFLFLGAEIETDCSNYSDSDDDDSGDDDSDNRGYETWNTYSLERAINACGFLDYVTPTHDSSLNDGAEFVTDPMTIEAWLDVYPVFEKAFRALLSSGLRAHDTDTCGLHVHVSRSFFRDSELAWSSLLLILEQNWPDMTRIARRRESHYAQRRLKFIADRDVPNRKELILKEGGKLWAKTDGERYVALNFRNVETIEFRLFRGTLNIETFYATLEFVWNLCSLAVSCSLEDALEVTIQDILTYKKWPHLDAYAKRLKFDMNHELGSNEQNSEGDE